MTEAATDDWQRKIQDWFTPSEEEQIKLILSGQCPHNKGYAPFGIGHNSTVYKCKLCGDIKFY